MIKGFSFSTNVPTLGAVADLDPETVNLAINLIRNENFILTENPLLSQTYVSRWLFSQHK